MRKTALFTVTVATALAFLSSAASPAAAATLKATTSNFSSVWSSAQGGDVIMLSAGTYSFSGGSKSGMVTIQPDTSAGANQSNVIFGRLDLGSAQNVTFQNVTIGGATVGTGTTAALHIHFVGNKFTGPLCINTPTNVNQDTLVDGNTFINVGQSCTEGRIGVTGNNKSHSVANGVVISNNLIQGSGPSDGIQINGGAYGTVIGPGNEFTGIKQSGCGSVHCDPIQFYGASNTQIIGNYFHGNSTGIMSPDCNGTKLTVKDNVFVTDGEYPDQVVQAGSSGDVYSHNTFANGARIRFGNPNGCGLNSNATITNNIITGGLRLTEGQSTGNFTISYNLMPSASGTQALTGQPTYSGGSLPNTLEGFALTSSSLGYRAASDGGDMGATLKSMPAALAPPTNVAVTVR
ncbi:MAG: hypothetical protein ACM336_03115 [Acidobacteriota bacterium]